MEKLPRPSVITAPLDPQLQPPLSSKPTTQRSPSSVSISRAPSSSSLTHQRDKIHLVLDTLNTKLTDVFQRRQSEVLEQYKQQLVELQKQLTRLRLSTNQQGLKQRLAEKKEQLNKQRTRFLEMSMYFQGKCEVFKQRLAKTVHVNRDLQADIRYLQQNMGKPLKKRVHKIASLFDGSGIGGPLKESKAKINKNIVDDQESAVDQSMLEKQHTEVKVQNSQLSQISPIKNQTTTHKPPPRKLQKLTELLNDPIFKPTQFQTLFLDSVQLIKKKKLEKSRNLPLLRRTEFIDSAKTLTDKISDTDLTDFDKRNIIEDFLSRDETKEYLYKVLFESEQSSSHEPDIFERQFT